MKPQNASWNHPVCTPLRHIHFLLLLSGSLGFGVCFAAEGPPPLNLHLVGDYGFCPWDSAQSLQPVAGALSEKQKTSRAYRVKDLNFCIRNIWVRDEETKGKVNVSNVRKEIEDGWNSNPRKTMIVRIDFWGNDPALVRKGTERFTGEMQSPEVYRDRVAAVLSQLEPVMGKLQGISLSEENVPYLDRPKVLQYLYDYFKTKYPGLRIFQWWSPNTAVPAPYGGFYLSADGWIVDPYSLSPEKYPQGPTVKRFVQKYLVTGKPLVFTLSASNEKGLIPLFPDKLNDQLKVCYDFNLPTIFYWTYQKDGSGPSTTLFGYPVGNELEDKMTERVFAWIKQVQATPENYTGNAAEMDTWDNPPLKVALKEEKKQLAGPLLSDDFSNTRFLDQSSGEGFRDLVWNGQELTARGFNERKTNVNMVYKIITDKAMPWPHASLQVRVNPQLHGQVRLALSGDRGATWPVTAVTESRDGKQLLSARVSACQELWVRIELRGETGSVKNPVVEMDDLQIWSALPLETKKPTGNAAEMDTWNNPPLKVALKEERKQPAGPLLSDDFSNMHFLDQSSGDGFRDLVWNGQELTARGFNGRKTNVNMVYKIITDKPMRWPHASLQVRVNPQLQGQVRIALSGDRGATWPVTAVTESRDGEQLLSARAWFSQDFSACQELWVRIELRGEAGSVKNPVLELDDLQVWSALPLETKKPTP